MNMNRALSSLLCLLLAATALPATASPIQWTLTDVLFEDGGVASGSFIYDADTATYSAIAITTSGGSLAPPASYGNFLVGTAGDAALTAAAGPSLTGVSLLQLIFQFPLTNAGGTVYLFDPFFPAASSFEGSCLNSGCTSYDFGRLVVDGGVVGAPAGGPGPGALVLLASAALALVGLRRRS